MSPLVPRTAVVPSLRHRVHHLSCVSGPAQTRIMSSARNVNPNSKHNVLRCLRKRWVSTWAKEVDMQALDKAVQQARSRCSQKGRAHRTAHTTNHAGERICACCSQYKSVALFGKSSSGRLSSYCRECVSVLSYNYRCTLRGRIQNMIAAARHRAARVRIRSRRDLECTLTVNDCLDILWAQRGRCYYSGVPLNFLQPNSHWRLSCERLDNHQGYTQNNCVLVAAEFNTSDYSVSPRVVSPIIGSAQWSKRKVAEVPSLCNGHHNLDVLERLVQEARVSGRCLSAPGRHRGLQREPNADGEWKCSSCQVYKPSSAFHRKYTNTGVGLSSLCAECKIESNRRYLATLRGSILNTLSNAARRARLRGHQFELDVDNILTKLWEQQGRCHYSGVPLAFTQHSNWRMSLERLRNDNGYTLQNCVWVANEFNTPDYSHNKAKFPVYGTAQWSKAKVEFVWGF